MDDDKYLQALNAKLDSLQVVREDELINRLSEIRKSLSPEIETAVQRAIQIRKEYVQACDDILVLIKKLQHDSLKTVADLTNSAEALKEV